MNHIFVDFENVHEVHPALFGAKSVSLTLFLGAQQTKLDAALVEQLMEHAASVQLVRLTTSGKNALDFTLAYYVGRAVMADPTGHFHIVSGDTGFDPLIEHLRSRQIHAARHAGFVPLTIPTLTNPPETLLARASEHLHKLVTNRPKSKKTLISHLHSCFDKTATAAEIEDLVNRLCKAGHLTIDQKGAVTYHAGLFY